MCEAHQHAGSMLMNIALRWRRNSGHSLFLRSTSTYQNANTRSILFSDLDELEHPHRKAKSYPYTAILKVHTRIYVPRHPSRTRRSSGPHHRSCFCNKRLPRPCGSFPSCLSWFRPPCSGRRWQYLCPGFNLCRWEWFEWYWRHRSWRERRHEGRLKHWWQQLKR